MFIYHSLGLLRALKERHIQDVSLASLQLAQKLLEIRIPSNAEWVVPSSKDRVSRLDLEVGLALITSESRGGHISDDVGEVWVQASNLEGELELFDCCRGRVVVLLRCPLHTVELLGEVRSMVVKSVSFLECKVSSPVANFDVPLQSGDVDQWLREFVSDLDWLKGSRWDLAERTVRKLRPSLLWRLCIASCNNCVFWNISRWELNFRLLFQCHVCGGAVSGELVDQELCLLLANIFRKRVERGEVGEGYAESLLCFWC